MECHLHSMEDTARRWWLQDSAAMSGQLPAVAEAGWLDCHGQIKEIQ
jgi:hypothetical protein